MTAKALINGVIPIDIFVEIFLHCIPPDPLKFRQPDVTIAPILLCHVCSYWREIAFRTPRIWAHLYHVALFSQNPASTLDNHDLTFLRWWRDKVKDCHPSLRLAFQQGSRRVKEGYQSVRVRTFLDFTVEFMCNAQSLNLDFSYNELHRTYLGGLGGWQHPFSCPNLDTLILRHRYVSHLRTRGTIYIKTLLPITPKEHLRRVLIEDTRISVGDVSSNLNFSIITHLHLAITATLDIWLSLLRQSVNLIHGSFSITFHEDLSNLNSLSQPKVLPQLRQMAFENLGLELHQSFLEGVHLPSLLALWINDIIPLTIDRLHQILLSTPALRTLQLGQSFFGTEIGVPPNFIFIHGDLAPVQIPLSDIVPHLSSIHFQYGPSTTAIFLPENRHLVVSVLTGDWLQVGRPGSRISRIQLGSSRDVTKQKLITLIQDLRSYLPGGVELSFRPPDLPDVSASWMSRHRDFTDGFEDLMLEEG